MSIISSICAEADRKIVKEACDIARENARAKYKDSATFSAIEEALATVLEHCEYYIQE